MGTDSAKPEHAEDDDSWFSEDDESELDESLPMLNAGDLVDLEAPEVEDCLSDIVPPRLAEKHLLLESNGKKSVDTNQSNPEDFDDNKWEFI